MLYPLKDLIRRLRDRVPGRAAVEACHEWRWRRDPLAHPALQQMTSTQLADLPFDPARICGDACHDQPELRPSRLARPKLRQA